MAFLQSIDPEELSLLAKLFRGFGDKSRLSIVLALHDGPLNVGEVVKATGLTQPTASSQLSCLWECGLVERRREGRRVYYRLRGSDTGKILQRALQVVDQVREHVQACERYSEERESHRAASPRKASGWA